MKVSEFLTLIRARIRDNYKLEYPDDELIGYLNDAITYWSSCSISNKDKTTVKTLIVDPYVDVPDDFGKFAGIYPVYIVEKRVISSGNDRVICKYYSFDAHVSSVNEVLRFDRPVISVLLQLTCIYALNRNQFDITTDTSLLKSLSDVVATARV